MVLPGWKHFVQRWIVEKKTTRDRMPWNKTPNNGQWDKSESKFGPYVKFILMVPPAVRHFEVAFRGGIVPFLMNYLRFDNESSSRPLL